MSTSETSLVLQQSSRAVRIWIITGIIMVFLQIVIGGVTRLTGSGLSITRWEVVTGTIPPLSQADWEEAFALYQQTPQYHKINRGMSLGEFKFIYFWEYFHRLWARLMFFVFVFPFAWFWWKGLLNPVVRRRLLIVVLLAGLEGFFGWIMVASGLIKRPWVNAYNLTLHLSMGILIFAYLLWTYFIARQPRPSDRLEPRWRKFGWWMVGIAFFQIALGAMMSGTKAGLFFPTWPDMQGMFLPGLLLDGSKWTGDSFIHYDTDPFVPALIQFLHRNTAYLLTGMVLYYFWNLRKLPVSATLRTGLWVLLVALGIQVLLGILTLINCIASVPVTLGVLHQAGAVVLLGVLLYVVYQSAPVAGSTKRGN
ncbi:MAG: COX15/CtaA family protein [Saprospiraceae bacterium]|nr:COX15/CtaA family protein [Saprospiraceae bacterium]